MLNANIGGIMKKLLDPFADRSLSHAIATPYLFWLLAKPITGVSCLAHKSHQSEKKRGGSNMIDYNMYNLIIAVLRLGLEIYKLYRDTQKPI